ncbi:MAG TPA: LysR family transcriptional regulator [Cyclobacteriaceae bacterium]|nr:LysR family transcriptional regulator [Cyclobacteriaceae bacterium]HRK52635.1 LysR family transcriptional regulator [Cyclobacteriaceae bacterium]
MAKKTKNNVVFRIWFFVDDEKLLGKGRVELLERIEKGGSIASAAKEMKMSYRQAWQMVSEMNQRARKKLVVKQLGGKSGGGATVTEEGKEAIKCFRELENKTRMFLEKEYKKLKF